MLPRHTLPRHPRGASRRLSRSARFAGVAAALLTAAPLLLAASPASAGVSYVALGDSYSSGLGAGSYSDGSCYQSSHAYPNDWAAADAPSSFTDATCSGATTADVVDSQLSALSPATTLVSITIGGNDVGFASVMETCVLGSNRDCVNAVDQAESVAASVLPGELATTYADIRSHAPGAKVVVLGYPDFYDLSKSSTCVGLSTTKRKALNGGADVLDNVVKQAAGPAGFTYVDVNPYFAGHQICDSHSWLHSVDWTFLEASYHPTAAGQEHAYEPALAGAAG